MVSAASRIADGLQPAGKWREASFGGELWGGGGRGEGAIGLDRVRWYERMAFPSASRIDLAAMLLDAHSGEAGRRGNLRK